MNKFMCFLLINTIIPVNKLSSICFNSPNHSFYKLHFFSLHTFSTGASIFISKKQHFSILEKCCPFINQGV